MDKKIPPYSNPSEIDFSKVFYDISLGEISDSEKEDLQKNYNIGENTDVIKLPVSKIKSFYKENVGEDISDSEIKTRLKDYYTYIEKYDAYYAELGDTMYRKVKCVSGEKSSDGL